MFLFPSFIGTIALLCLNDGLIKVIGTFLVMVVIQLMFFKFYETCITDETGASRAEMRKFAMMAYRAINNCDLAALRSHPLWDTNSRRRNPQAFSRLQECSSYHMLLSATEKGAVDIVQFLIEQVKVDPNQQTSSGECAIHRAAYRGRSEILQFLLANRADMEKPKSMPEEFLPDDAIQIHETALKYACIRGNLDSVRILLRHGCKIDFF